MREGQEEKEKGKKKKSSYGQPAASDSDGAELYNCQ